MEKSFSLLYFESLRSNLDLSKSIQGPLLFGSEEVAVEHLYSYVKERLTTCLEAVFYCYIDKRGWVFFGVTCI